MYILKNNHRDKCFYLHNTELLGYSNDEINVIVSLGSKFNYNELMNEIIV